MAKLFDIMGNFPFKPEDKKPMLIRKQDYSTALYPPNNAFTSDNTLGVSNEIADDEAVIDLKNGILIMIESRD